MALSDRPLVKNTKSAKNSMQQLSLVLFDSAIKSPKTRDSYIGYLNEFRDFFIVKSYDSLIEIDQKTTRMLENFMMYQKK